VANTPVAVINASKTLKDADVKRVVRALQRQVHEDFAPVWRIDADLTFVPSGQEEPAGAWWLVILDNSDQAGDLGYHDLTAEGLPLGKVFAATDEQYGMQWTVTASHELLEMLADPDINLTAFKQTSETTGTLYAYEVCDACEADQFGYVIDDVLVSDFVYPSWFESFWQQGATQFDHQNQITAPLGLLAGGYIGAFDIASGGGWHLLTAEKVLAYHSRPQVGSRRERRRTRREHWLPSLSWIHRRDNGAGLS
jgi:hypothetical protein